VITHEIATVFVAAMSEVGTRSIAIATVFPGYDAISSPDGERSFPCSTFK
jgi:hypothetical protein